MSALYRLKAYFGMVPAEELDDYAFGEDDRDPTGDDYDYEPYEPAYEPAYKQGRRGQEVGHGADRRAGRGRWSDSSDRYEADGYDGKDYDGKSYDGKSYDGKGYGAKDYGAKDYDGKGYDTDGYYTDEPEPARPARHGNARGWAAEAPVRGALAVDPNREAREAREVRNAPEVHVAARARPAPAEEVHPLARITTLHPRTYNEARTIGEHYREGIPVIMNLTEMADADAKRLVDFAAGLAFALRGSIDKITTKVFLISPPNVDVTAEDRRRLAEGSFLNRSV